MRSTGSQLGLFGLEEPAPAPAPPHPVVESLKTVDPNNLTPMQALELIARLAAEAHRS